MQLQRALSRVHCRAPLSVAASRCQCSAQPLPLRRSPVAIRVASLSKAAAGPQTSGGSTGRRAVAAMASAAAGLPSNHRAAFKAALRSGKPLFGLFINSASPLVAEQMATLDYDYMLVDIQHAPTDYANLGAMITAVNAAGKPALVRVEGPGDRGGIQQSLDLGAAGIMVPTVNTAADVERAVSAAYYPSEVIPFGNRSISWPIRPQLGRSPADYIAAANDEVSVLVQVETRECYEDLEAVLSVPGVDCCFMGPVDLSHALGLAQRLGFPACFDKPEFQEVLQRVVATCRAKGVTPGNFALTEQKAQDLLGQGFSLLATGTDVGLLGDAAAKNAAFARKLRGQQA